jgi:hypothetical protein
MGDDEVGKAAMVELMGTCTTHGIVLGMTSRTDPEAVDAEITRLVGELPGGLGNALERLVALLVPRGIEFQRDELSKNTPKVQAWRAEFDLLNDTGPRS